MWKYEGKVPVLSFDDWCKNRNYSYERDLEQYGEKKANKLFSKMSDAYDKYFDRCTNRAD